MRRIGLVLAALGLVCLAICCGSKSSSSSGGTTPPPSGVSINPKTASVSRGGTQRFAALVEGATDQTVVWEVNGTRGGSSSYGLISEDGVYIAPTTVPNPSTVSVTAASFSDISVSASASVSIQTGSSVSVIVSGSSGRTSVQTFGTHGFTATVSGNSNTAVTWQVNGVTGGSAVTGTIDQAGLYTAPHSVPVSSLANNLGQTTEVLVTAVSQADSSASDSAIVVPVPPQVNRQSKPIPLGVTGGNAQDTSTSGSQSFCCGGTLGSLVTRGGLLYILSNNHVLARSDQGVVGESIVQPSLVDNRCSANGLTQAGTLSQFVNLETESAPRADCAMAEIITGAVDALGTIMQLGSEASGGLPTDGTPNAGPGVAPTVSRPVAKSGSATGITCGSILAIDTSVSVTYQKGCATGSTFDVLYTNQIDVTGTGFSGEGDSGSLIVTQDTADPVGLLYGGSDTDTVANPVSDVLQHLADPVSAETPLFVGDPAVGPHQVAACTLLLSPSGTPANPSAQVSTVSALGLQAAAAVLDAHAQELLAYPGVQALGQGTSYDDPSQPVIVLFVTRMQAVSAFPAVVDGIRTRVVEGGSFAKSGQLTAAETEAVELAAAPPKLVYPISEAEVTRARAAVSDRAVDLMERSGIQGVGVSSSLDAPGEGALMIFAVRGVARDTLPATIDGVRTRIRETSRFHAR
jgi:hypothetical protein